jgi:hypothetical protein
VLFVKGGLLLLKLRLPPSFQAQSVLRIVIKVLRVIAAAQFTLPLYKYKKCPSSFDEEGQSCLGRMNNKVR